MKKEDTRCRNCGKRTAIIGPLSQAKCLHCGQEILAHHKLMIHINCNKCGYIYKRHNFGWTETKCDNCGNPAKHPATVSKGGRPDRGIKNDAQLSFVLPLNDYKEIMKLAKFYGSTKGAVARHLIKVGLDKIS
jgi:ribosomal protein S27AE